MKRKRFSDAQIVSILYQQEAGKSVKNISREHGKTDERPGGRKCPFEAD